MITQTKVPAPGQEQAPNKTTRAIDPNTHAGKVLAALRKRPASNIELIRELGIAHPPAAIRDLRRGGIRIETRECPHPSRPGQKIKRYYLIEG